MKSSVIVIIVVSLLVLAGYKVINKNNPLQGRAKRFLETPIPEGMSYVPDSISERFIREYANNGKVVLDPELGELLEIVVMESPIVEGAKPGTEEAYMNESALILRAILNEHNR